MAEENATAVVEQTPPATEPKRRGRPRGTPQPQSGTLIDVDQQSRQPATNPGDLIAIAVESNLDIDKLERLLQLKREHDAEQARKEFFLALSKFQSEIPPIVRESKADMGKAGKRRYADLGTINEAIRPFLYCNGLSFRFKQSQEANQAITITCIVSHSAGHSEETSLTAFSDTSGGKNSIQAVGSTITYLQRYTLIGGLGLATVDADDDGAGANAEPKELTKEDRLALALAAAGASAKAVDPGTPPAEPGVVSSVALDRPKLATKEQISELEKQLDRAFDTQEEGTAWFLKGSGGVPPHELTETEMADCIAAASVEAADNLRRRAAAKLEASGTTSTVTYHGGTGANEANPTPGEVTPEDPNACTSSQRDVIKVLVGKLGMSSEKFVAGLREQYKVSTVRSLTRQQADDLVKDLEEAVAEQEAIQQVDAVDANGDPVPF